jgi:hypothetical protein
VGQRARPGGAEERGSAPGRPRVFFAAVPNGLQLVVK